MSRPIASESPFRAIADPTRRKIIDMLRRGDMPAHQIAASFEMKWPSVSAHLRVLRESGLIAQRRQGRQRLYTLVVRNLRPTIEWLRPYAGALR